MNNVITAFLDYIAKHTRMCFSSL